MTQRIIDIKGCKTCKKVLIFLDRNESGEELVRIVAWHDHDDMDLIQSAEVEFCKTESDHLMKKRFIADFSEVSANEFANSFKL